MLLIETYEWWLSWRPSPWQIVLWSRFFCWYVPTFRTLSGIPQKCHRRYHRPVGRHWPVDGGSPRGRSMPWPGARFSYPHGQSGWGSFLNVPVLLFVLLTAWYTHDNPEEFTFFWQHPTSTFSVYPPTTYLANFATFKWLFGNCLTAVQRGALEGSKKSIVETWNHFRALLIIPVLLNNGRRWSGRQCPLITRDDRWLWKNKSDN